MSKRRSSPATRQFLTALGQRVREQREQLGLSRNAVDTKVGIPRGSMARLEAGQRDLDPARMLALADMLEVRIGYFFDDLPALGFPKARAGATPEDELQLEKFLQAYYRISNTNSRQEILALVKSIAASDEYD